MPMETWQEIQGDSRQGTQCQHSLHAGSTASCTQPCNFGGNLQAAQPGAAAGKDTLLAQSARCQHRSLRSAMQFERETVAMQPGAAAGKDTLLAQSARCQHRSLRSAMQFGQETASRVARRSSRQGCTAMPVQTTGPAAAAAGSATCSTRRVLRCTVASTVPEWLHTQQLLQAVSACCKQRRSRMHVLLTARPSPAHQCSNRMHVQLLMPDSSSALTTMHWMISAYGQDALPCVFSS
jgi:hypothetical protein